jgi:hypothetical protein
MHCRAVERGLQCNTSVALDQVEHDAPSCGPREAYSIISRNMPPFSNRSSPRTKVHRMRARNNKGEPPSGLGNSTSIFCPSRSRVPMRRIPEAERLRLSTVYSWPSARRILIGRWPFGAVPSTHEQLVRWLASSAPGGRARLRWPNNESGPCSNGAKGQAGRRLSPRAIPPGPILLAHAESRGQRRTLDVVLYGARVRQQNPGKKNP